MSITSIVYLKRGLGTASTSPFTAGRLNGSSLRDLSMRESPPPPVSALIIPPFSENITKGVSSPVGDNSEATKTTNIKVCVRVRPVIFSGKKLDGFSSTKAKRSPKQPRHAAQSAENDKKYECAWALSDDTIQQATWTEPDPTRKNSYKFDKVYSPSIDTSTVYEDSIRDIVHSVVEGYHGSVFAYGQTGTGKTYTMHGVKDDPGIVSQAVSDIFNQITTAKSESIASNREFLLRVSYVEIYNEQIFDLLAPSNDTRFPSAIPRPSQIRIFEQRDRNGTCNITIRGLKEEIVTHPEQVYQLIASGNMNRHTGSTNFNKSSSRSHSIFRIVVESRVKNPTIIPHLNANTNATVPPKVGDLDSDSTTTSYSAGTDFNSPVRVSSLSLVDLAGSESVKNSGTVGQRSKEGLYINKSLMTLGHVIYKLAEISSQNDNANISAKQKHIPYRDSKLTRMLQTSLSGNAQICVICNVSPTYKNVEETHNTLKFAVRAKRIKQTATVNEVAGHDDKILLQSYRQEIESLKCQLKDMKEQQQILTPTKIHNVGVDEDVKALVKAIKNVETLIISSKTKGDEVSLNSGSSKDRELESLLVDDDKTQYPAKYHGSLPQSCSTVSSTSMFTSTLDDSTNNSNKNNLNLTEQLSSIQKLLRHVLSLKSKNEEDTLITSDHNYSPVQLSPVESRSVSPFNIESLRDINSDTQQLQNQELSLLRHQLKEQEVATSMRNADNTFLESQLLEKDR